MAAYGDTGAGFGGDSGGDNESENDEENETETQNVVQNEMPVVNEKPTLKEHLSNLPQIYEKLEQNQMTDIEIFIYITEKDLETICGADGIGLSLVQRLKFKAAIKKLQQKFPSKKPSSSSPSYIVPPSKDEIQVLDQLKSATKRAKEIQSLLEAHVDRVDAHVVKMKDLVDQRLKTIMNTLLQRKKILYKQIEEWKFDKLQEANDEIPTIRNYQDTMKSALTQCDEIMADHGETAKDREAKIKKIAKEAFEREAMYKSVGEYIMKHTQMIKVVFDENIISGLQSFGKLQATPDSVINISSISLKEAIKTKDIVGNGYQVQLQWETCAELQNDSDIMIKFQKDLNDTDDEKKMSDSWKMAKYDEIRSNDNKYSTEIIDTFKYDINYIIKVIMNIKEPISIKIPSNTITLRQNTKLLDLKGGTGGKDGEKEYFAPNGVKVISSNPVHNKTSQHWYIGYAFNGETDSNPCFLSTGSKGTLTFIFPKEIKLSYINVYPTCASRVRYVTDYNIEVWSSNKWEKLFDDFVGTKDMRIGEKNEHLIQKIVTQLRFNLIKRDQYICLQEIDFFVVD